MSGFKYIENNRVSKAQKRRDAKAAKKAEQIKRIEEGEKLDEHRDRSIEQQQLEKILTTHQLKIHEVDADGDCLYKAVEHQLSIADDPKERLSFSQIRERTSRHMLEHPDNFMPFLLNDSGELMSQKDFEKYCLKVANTKEWGGHLELTAIAELTEKPIKIFQANSKVPIMIEPSTKMTREPMMLSFHKHLYHLGEHYNSVCKSS